MIFFSSSFSSDIYSQKCVGCHKDMSYSLQEIFMRYLLAYGGENNVKAGMLHYFMYPSKDISVMPKDFLEENKINSHSNIDENALKRSINIYWEKYKVKDRLK
ncbi:MAG: hypothetical protein IE880_01115 [Epsilonproteobacteria bacterium]|nr:hypothetical protein [Campylobacterota bacterium]